MGGLRLEILLFKKEGKGEINLPLEKFLLAHCDFSFLDSSSEFNGSRKCLSVIDAACFGVDDCAEFDIFSYS